MNRDELLRTLQRLMVDTDDPEAAHIVADEALLAFINDSEIAKAYTAIPKWYA